MRADADVIWWALILANLLLGFLFSYILSKAGIATAAAGAAVGAVVGLLTTAMFDLFNYAFLNSGDMTAMVVDVLASIVVSAIVCAIIGWYNGRGAKAAA